MRDGKRSAIRCGGRASERVTEICRACLLGAAFLGLDTFPSCLVFCLVFAFVFFNAALARLQLSSCQFRYDLVSLVL